MSVVVLTHNSFAGKGGCVRHALAALSHQKGVHFEVIVVDNGSTPEDHTRLLRSCKDTGLQQLDLQVVSENLSIGAARNAGAWRARGDLIVFLDDDALLLDNQALAQVKNVASTASFGYAAERLWTLCHPWFEEHHDSLLDALRAGDFEPLVQCCGAPQISIESERIFYQRSYIGHFGFVHRNLFRSVGGFPNIFQGYGCEDDALSLLLYLKDPSFGWLGDVRVAHVDHARPPRYVAEHAKNRRRYACFLADHGISEFHTDVLLAGARAIEERPVVLPL